MKRFLAALGVAGALMIGVGLASSPVDARTVPHWYCSTTTTQGQACIPDPTTTVHYGSTTTQGSTTTAASTTLATTIATTTTAATTTQATTTVPQTTTTVGNCGICAGQFGTTTTVPSTTSTVAKTTTTVTTVPATTIPDTTAVDQTLPPSATTSVGEELPHTGTETDLLLAFGFGALFLGWGSFALLEVTKKK